MDGNFLENIYFNYKFDLIPSEIVPNFIVEHIQCKTIEDIQYKEIVNPSIWEFLSISKPTKIECDYYFDDLLTNEFINLTKSNFSLELILFWWRTDLINIRTLKLSLDSLSKYEIIEEDLYDELIDFVDFNEYDWDYEQYFNSIVDEIISKSQNTNLFEFYKPLTNVENEKNDTITITKRKKKDNIFKGLTLINWIQLVLVFPIFIIYIILALIKKLINKNFR